jgi:AcrR family transcriptional regulator
MKRVSKAEWLQMSLAILKEEGIEGIRVEHIARKIGVSKSGFYWHFKDLEDLKTQIVEYWAHEFTEVITSNPILRECDPRDRLERIMEMIVNHDLVSYEIEMRAWAKTDPKIARKVFRVYRLRLNFIREIFTELGFEGDDLEMRTRLFLGYQSWERSLFPTESKKSLLKLIPLRVELLTKK